MKIESYAYGSMIVDGSVYDKDLIIFPDHIHANWWRKEGHLLGIEDLQEVLKFKPQILVVGTGESGFMRVPLTTRLALQQEDIELIAKDTRKAVQYFNEQLASGKLVAGAFHLTC